MRKWVDAFTLAVIVLSLVSCAVSWVLIARNWAHGKDGGTVRDTVRAVYVDTVRIVQPVARDSVVVRYIKVRVPRAEGGKDTLGGGYKNTDSAEVVMPITQKRYSDSTYTAWVSGFRPALDSIHVHPRREMVTVTNTVRGKPKRWGVGIHAGYGMTPRGLQPYIGVGVNYSILAF